MGAQHWRLGAAVLPAAALPQGAAGTARSGISPAAEQSPDRQGGQEEQHQQDNDSFHRLTPRSEQEHPHLIHQEGDQPGHRQLERGGKAHPGPAARLLADGS